MQPLKFRAYIKSLRILTNHIAYINFDCQTVGLWITTPDEGDPSEYSFDEVELSQDTGMADIEGTHIFEGDILKNMCPRLKNKKHLYKVVKYEEKSFHMGYTTSINYAIIGNIFENPIPHYDMPNLQQTNPSILTE